MKKILSVMLVVMLAFGVMATAAFADASISASSDKTVVAPGETFTVTVSISGNEGILSGNSDVSVTNGTIESLNAGILAGGAANPSTGKINGAASEAMTGDGALYTATIKAGEAGTAEVSVVVTLRGEGGVKFVNKAAASVSVEVKGDEPTPPPHEHTWDEGTVTKEPTCTEEGEKTLTCTGCGESKVEKVPATGHVPAAERVNVSETYTGDVVCIVCGTVLEKGEEIKPDACDHVWDEGKAVVTKEPTCTEEGEKTFTCKVCGETKVEKIPALGHEWDEGKVTKEPTCTAAGEKTFTCKIDKTHVKTEAIPAKSHDLEKVERVEPTKDKDGNIEYYVCKECHKLFKDKDGKTEIKQEDTVLKYATPTPAPTKAPTAPGGNAAGSNPKTGDETNIALYVAILTVCGAAAIAVVSKKKNNG